MRFSHLLLPIVFSTLAQAAEFHVAINGADTQPGTSALPFATLQKAQAAVRQLRAGKPYAESSKQVRIILHGGLYRMPQALTLTQVDSNTILQAAPGEQVTLSGGVVLGGWEPVKDAIFKADLTKLGLANFTFREIYADGERQHWARVPNFDPKNPRRGGFLRNAGLAEPATKTVFRYREGELDPSRWTEKGFVWAVFHDSLNYKQSWQPVYMQNIDPVKRTFRVNHGDYVLSASSPYYLCGLMAELDAPGEWCVDQVSKTLHFKPSKADIATQTIVVPKTENIIVISGDAKGGKLAENIRIENIHFVECRKEAVLMSGALRCAVIGCDLRNVGTGVFLGDDTHRCRVAGCDMTQTLRDGVTVWGTSDDHSRITGHQIDNNYIWDFGWGDIHNRCGGVFMRRCSDIHVTHNLIHDGPRYAIGSDVGNDMEIAWNHCHHVNLTTSDTSIIEGGTAWDWTLPDDIELKRNREHNWGNSIHHNLCYDSGGWSVHGHGTWHFPDYSWGIYLDLENSGWHVHSNIIYDTVEGAYMQNAGLETLVENNIFVGGQTSQVRFNMWLPYIMSGHRSERNIIAYQGRSATLYQARELKPENARYIRNLIHCGSGNPVIEGVPAKSAEESWATWQAMGQDAGSLLADPEFKDAAKRDYRLKPSSPAMKLGFRPLDLQTAGIYSSAERRVWPREEVAVVRQAADYTEPAIVLQQPLLRSYDDYELGEMERKAVIGPSYSPPFHNKVPSDQRSRSGVTDAYAYSGKQSMSLVRPASTKELKVFSPYIAYPYSVSQGKLSFSMALRLKAGTAFLAEARNAPQKYQTGPRIFVDVKGNLMHAGKPLMQLPSDSWFLISTGCTLSPEGQGKFQITVTLPNEKPRVFADLAYSLDFKGLETFVITLAGEASGEVWLDDLRINAQADSQP
jgi:Right handed beta helix region